MEGIHQVEVGNHEFDDLAKITPDKLVDVKPEFLPPQSKPDFNVLKHQSALGEFRKASKFGLPGSPAPLTDRLLQFCERCPLTASAVIQSKRGIGDVIWHLPFVRAIAAASPGGKVTFLAPESSGAKELLAAEPSVAQSIYFEHSGNELRRVVNLFRLANLLRQNRFQTVWILDRTSRPALAAALAGIPARIGPGLGRQRLFITNRGIDRSYFHKWPMEWLVALLAEMDIPLATSQPELSVADDMVGLVGERFEGLPRPWVVLGLGASHSAKDWPDRHWRQFIAALRQRTSGSVFLVGGADNVSRAGNFAAHGGGANVLNACDLKLGEAAALLHLADLFVGPDSGPMNIAAATGTDAFALFGATPAAIYSKFIHPIVPEGGPTLDGMGRISPLDVLSRIEPYLNRPRAEK